MDCQNDTKSTMVCAEVDIVMELKKQMRLAGPLVVVSFLQFSLQMISIVFVGHLNDQLYLSSASMATSFATVTGFSFMLGMGSALETLCGQAYGAKQYHMLGIHMQRAMLVLSLVSIPIALLWGFTEQVFIILKQDPEISFHAGIYARWLIPSILPYGLLQCQLGFLQTQNITFASMITAGVSSLVHVLSCWTLIFRFGFGNRGAALSIAISYWINVLMLAIYIRFSPACQKSWTGFSREALRNLFEFIELSIPSALMVCLEEWSYEFLVLMSTLLPNPKLEASIMSISANTIEAVFRIPLGFGSAVSTRVSNELGAGRFNTARLAVQVALLFAATEGLILSVAAVALRGIWCYAYTSDEQVVKYIASIAPILAILSFIDGIQAVLSGTVRGCGWQDIGAYVNLGAYYLVGLPSAAIFTFLFHLRGKGMWMGITCGSCLQTMMLFTITMRTNWEQEANKAKERVFASRIPVHESKSLTLDFPLDIGLTSSMYRQISS